MLSAWLPLLGVVFFLGVLCWRAWWQRRRYGSSGVLLVLLLVGQAVRVASRPESPPSTAAIWQATGTVLLFGGIVLLVMAQLNLGASWRIGIEEGSRPGLVTSGVYRFCRNPIFLAILIILAGYTVLLPTRLSLALLVGAFIGIRQQVLTEEMYLCRTYGGVYRAYARRVGRFVPGIGRLR
jgi:protein-S-isoprenylcysteine O-methyltransferase Ste14